MKEAFLGAIVGSGLTIVAHWFLGPRIERRVRAHERWEQFLVEFASLIEGPVLRAHHAARSAWQGWHALHEIAAERGDVDPGRLAELNVQNRAEFREVLNAWSDVLVRAEWLAKRITGDYGIADDELRRFYTRWLFYRHQQRRWDPWGDQPTETPSDWDRSREAHMALVENIEALSSRIGLPIGLVQRLRARRRRRRELRNAAKRDAHETVDRTTIEAP